MKKIIYILLTGTICLYGCKKSESTIENSLLLHGEEGRLWFLHHIVGENPQYLWFDHYGNFQTLELGIANEPILYIPEENLPLSMDSSSNCLVYLNGLPYRMQTDNEGWEGPTGTIITRTFTPDEDNFEWYRILYAHYDPRIEKMHWFLAETFIPLENHCLNGQWESLSDSIVLLNGQSFRLVENEIVVVGYENSFKGLILYDMETGDSIQLLDACFPPYAAGYWERYHNAQYDKWEKKLNKKIKSSVLLKGEKYKLYQCFKPDINYWNSRFDYYDYHGIFTYNPIIGVRNFLYEINNYRDFAVWWYQDGNTIYDGENQETMYTILNVSSSGDTIRLWDSRKNLEFLYIDTKNPIPRKKK